MVDKLTDVKLHVVCGAIELIQHYYNTFIHKNPCMNSSQIGNKWSREVLDGNGDRCFKMLRMDKNCFYKLCNDLQANYGLQGSSRTNVTKITGMFLHILGHGVGNKLAQKRFQHSAWTVCTYFSKVLDAICLMSVDVLKPQDLEFKDIPIQILNGSRHMPHFKDCIDAIDDVHVQACITPQNQVPFISRKEIPTQNIIVVCNFDMQFIYALVGWEGKAHDAHIFFIGFAMEKKQWKILRDMPSYSFEKQVKIVVATMTLHNYIMRHTEQDRHFAKIADNYGRVEDNDDLEPHITSVTRSLEMDALRDVITGSLMGT
ncbi:hypothetical protein UlMin_032590 [Ulmus minor]